MIIALLKGQWLRGSLGLLPSEQPRDHTPLLAWPLALFQAPLRTQLDSAPWSLNPFQGPPRSQHSPVQPTHRVVLGHVCGWSNSHLEQDSPMDLQPAEKHALGRKFSVQRYLWNKS